MPNKNSVSIAGHLGRDPEMRSTTSGISICNFSVAVTERSGKGDDAKEKTTWLDCKAWRDTAELIAENFKKGSAIAIEGKLDVEAWEDKQTNQKRSKVVIVANSVSIPLYKKKAKAAPASDDQDPAANFPQGKPQSEKEADSSLPF